jgi:hypothetical protein
MSISMVSFFVMVFSLTEYRTLRENLEHLELVSC